MTKAPRIQYSENEAARILGLSVDELRALVRDHILNDPDSDALDTYEPTDLVLLRVLAGKRAMQVA